MLTERQYELLGVKIQRTLNETLYGRGEIGRAEYIAARDALSARLTALGGYAIIDRKDFERKGGE